MKRRWTLLFIVVAVVTIATAALPATAAGTAATTGDFEHGTLVVRYAAGTSSHQQADIARRNGERYYAPSRVVKKASALSCAGWANAARTGDNSVTLGAVPA